MVDNFTFKDAYNFDDLIEIVRILRAPGGCPWDAEQTHKSIRGDFLEETYEVLEAIDTENPVLLEEELGDILLQVALHTDMAREDGQFDINGVADGVCKKMIIRHPHVFGDVVVKDTADVLSNWDSIKRQTKNQNSQSEAIAAIPATYPALMKAQKVQSKAKKAGFDWREPDGAFQKVAEEAAELKEALKGGKKEEIQDELGDLFFAAVNVARFCDCDAETALELATKKFTKRFAVVEELAQKYGVNMKEASIEKLDELWDEAKIICKQKA